MTDSEVVTKGAIGTATSWLAAGVSLLPNLEQGLRIASLCVGLLVGLVTLVQLVRKSK